MGLTNGRGLIHAVERKDPRTQQKKKICATKRGNGEQTGRRKIKEKRKGPYKHHITDKNKMVKVKRNVKRTGHSMGGELWQKKIGGTDNNSKMEIAMKL